MGFKKKVPEERRVGEGRGIFSAAPRNISWVYATMRNLAKKGQLEEEGQEQLGDTLIIKQMDVCSDESVKKSVQEILETDGKIDVLCKLP